MTQGIGDSNEDEMKMYLIEDEELAQFKEDKMREKKRRTKIDAPAFSDAGQSDEDSMSDWTSIQSLNRCFFLVISFPL